MLYLYAIRYLEPVLCWISSLSGAWNLSLSEAWSLSLSGAWSLSLSGAWSLSLSGAWSLSLSGAWSLSLSGAWSLSLSGAWSLSLSGAWSLSLSGAWSLSLSGASPYLEHGVFLCMEPVCAGSLTYLEPSALSLSRATLQHPNPSPALAFNCLGPSFKPSLRQSGALA